MMKEIQCPYCEQDNEHDSEQADPNTLHYMQCRECEKNFAFEIDYCPRFYERKADCLNGGDHNWRDLLPYASSNHYDLYRECRGCNKREYKLKPKEEKGLVK